MSKEIELKLSNEKCIEIFFNALCNGLGYIGGYGITIDCDRDAYNDARAKLDVPAFEDVLIQVLKDGGVIQFVDNEGEETTDVTLDMVLERIPQVELDTLMEMIQEQDDACTADIILQTVIYGEVQFG